MGTQDLLNVAANSADPKAGLRAIVSLRALADSLERQQVAAAVDSGMTWQEIADALGVSRQAVHKKFARQMKGR